MSEPRKENPTSGSRTFKKSKATKIKMTDLDPMNIEDFTDVLKVPEAKKILFRKIKSSGIFPTKISENLYELAYCGKHTSLESRKDNLPFEHELDTGVTVTLPKGTSGIVTGTWINWRTWGIWAMTDLIQPELETELNVVVKWAAGNWPIKNGDIIGRLLMVPQVEVEEVEEEYVESE